LIKKSLSSKERIKSKKDLKNIFTKGIFLVSEDRKIKAQYIVNKNPGEAAGVKIAAAINKKSGNAVWRNRLKRLLRESYRLNKEILLNISKEKNLHLHVVFSAGTLNQKEHKKIKLQDIMSSIIDVMIKIKERL
jgi:ribonuclease P protein component